MVWKFFYVIFLPLTNDSKYLPDYLLFDPTE